MTQETEIVLTLQQKVFAGVLVSTLGGIALGALGLAWNTRELVKANEARLDHIEQTRFTESDGLLMIESIRAIIRDEIDRSFNPIREDIQELKKAVGK